jgi:hypothetical protein
MKKRIAYLFFLCLPVFITTGTHAQLLKKLKDKIEKKVTGTPDETKTTDANSSTASNQSQSQGSSGGPTNKGGGGLKNTPPPDVNQQIADAETAHTAGNYSDARYSIQQALMGVEIQIGQLVLKSLPPVIDKLPKDTLQDKVASTQWGWNNMTIERIYTDKKDKQLKITIGNNAIYSGFANAFFMNAYSQQADANNQKSKQVKVKGNKAIIEYDDSKGYTLIMPMGQSSMIVWECVNFADENEVMAAANSFDIDGIKKMMGEK